MFSRSATTWHHPGMQLRAAVHPAVLLLCCFFGHQMMAQTKPVEPTQPSANPTSGSLTTQENSDEKSNMELKSLEDIDRQIGNRIEPKLTQLFAAARAPYPPGSVILIAYKAEKTLEVWVPLDNRYVKIHQYAIQGASGHEGPKLKNGDKQVPEGLYRITTLNPNSKFYLSMKLDYPNEFDQANALADRRDDPGSDIYIHGKDQSVGCLAMGDDSMEELFLLAMRVGFEQFEVIIAPNRTIVPTVSSSDTPQWQPELYARIKSRIEQITGQTNPSLQTGKSANTTP